MPQTNELIGQLRSTLSKMELALGVINEAIVWTNPLGNIEWCNKTFDRLSSYSHIEILGKNILDILPLKKNAKKISFNEQLQATQSKKIISNIYQYQHKSKKLFLEISTQHLIIDNEATIIIVLKDITKEQSYIHDLLKKDKLLQRQSDLLAEEKAYVDNIIRSMSNMLIVVNRDGTIKTVNQAALLMLGYKREELIGKNLKTILATPDHILEDIVSLKSIANVEVGCKTKTGNIKPNLLSGSVMFDPQGKISAIVTIAQDISERKEMENRLRYLSTHDSLTNLPNRALFDEVLEKAIQYSKHTKHNIALLYIDLDFFKNVNDKQGHPTGDLLLMAIGERIKASIRKDDIAARLGGDEFAVILSNIESSKTAGEIAQKLIKTLGNKYILDGKEIRITASIGIALTDLSHDIPARDLRKNADLAMYKAKAMGRNSYQYYTERDER